LAAKNIGFFTEWEKYARKQTKTNPANTIGKLNRKTEINSGENFPEMIPHKHLIPIVHSPD
jgi:hypothetical protein